MPGQDSMKIIAKNKQATHLYFLEELLEVGIELAGTEVKSIRQGKVNLKDSWVFIGAGQAYVRGMHISPYEKGNIFNKDPLRERRLLLHKREILKLHSAMTRDGYSVIPVTMYFKGSRVKMEIALARGKKLHDKRDSAAEKDAKRSIDRVLKESNRQD